MGLIYLDACLLIYLAERHVRWGQLVADAMARAANAQFGISPLVKCECLVGRSGAEIQSWNALIMNCSGFSRH